MTPHATHHGVVALVTNAARTRFFLQQKDASYQPFPRGYSLFGGAVEAGEDLAASLARELREELGAAAGRLLDAGLEPVFTRALADGFVLSLFEVVLADPLLESLADVEVLEGERGVVLDRATLPETPFIWGLGQVVAEYLELHPAPAG